MRKYLSRIMTVIMIFSIVLMPQVIIAEEEVTEEGAVTEEITPEEYAELFKDTMELLYDIGLSEDINYKDLFEVAMEAMVSSTDPYSQFMTSDVSSSFTNAFDPSFVGIGVQLQNNDGENAVVKVFNNSPASDAGVMAGDIFKIVDGVDVSAATLEELMEILLGESGSEVSITFLRDGEEVSFTMIRDTFVITTVNQLDINDVYEEATEELNKQATYIQIDSFGDQTDEEFTEIMEGLEETDVEYIILDLRNNPGGYVSSAINICNDIIPEGEIISFTNKYGQSTVYVSELEAAPFRIITLVNESSASASEIVASAIQDSEVGLLVGESTYGKGVSQYIFTLSNEYKIKVTGQEFVSRNGSKINEVGITPDYIVEVPEYISSDRRLYVNDELDAVLQVETILDYLGYNVGEPDAKYDWTTYYAVKQFQSDVLLYPYGTCDFTTQEYLNTALYQSLAEEDIQLNQAINVILEEINNQ